MKIFSILFIMLLMGGCTTAPPKEKIVTVYKTKNVYIPQPCDAKVTCDFSGDGFVPTKKLLECVVKQKRALEYCRQGGMK